MLKHVHVHTLHEELKTEGGLGLASTVMHGQCALKRGVPASDARICDVAGANETLCHLLHANCTWLSPAEEAHLQLAYDLEVWLPVVALVLVVLCPLLCWPIWCNKQRSSLETRILSPAAASINSPSTAEVAAQRADYAAKMAAAHAFRRSFQANQDEVPGRVDPGHDRRQLPRPKPAVLPDLGASSYSGAGASAVGDSSGDGTIPIGAELEPLANVSTSPDCGQLDESVQLEYGTPPEAVLNSCTVSPTVAHRGRASSPTISDASSVNSDDFDDALDHEPD